MPRKRATPPQEPPALLTPYTDDQGRVLLVLVRLHGKARVFATERRPPFRQKGDPPPAPPAEKRAEEWCREFGARDLAWGPPREVIPFNGEPPLDAAAHAVQADLAWLQEQSERKRKKRSA